jgi:hypothetical protein
MLRAGRRLDRQRRGYRVAAIGIISMIMALLVPLTSAAVTCTRTACDNQGPVATGCTTDSRLVGAYGDRVILYYSSPCRAFWSYSSSPPVYADATIWIERARYVNGQYVVEKRLSRQLAPGELSDWTNMLGVPADGTWRYFRGIIDYTCGETCVYYTQWHWCYATCG